MARDLTAAARVVEVRWTGDFYSKDASITIAYWAFVLQRHLGHLLSVNTGAPYGNRTRVSALRGPRPRPLDEGSEDLELNKIRG